MAFVCMRACAGVVPECAFTRESRMPSCSLRRTRVLLPSGVVVNEWGTLVHDRKLHPLCNGSHDSCADFDDERGPCVKTAETRVLLACVNVLWLRFKVPWEGSAASELIDFWKSSLSSVFSFCSVCSDSGRGTLSQAASASEPEHCGVDLAARGPLACGHPPRTPYPRIHCPERKRRAAAAAGEPRTQSKFYASTNSETCEKTVSFGV